MKKIGKAGFVGIRLAAVVAVLAVLGLFAFGPMVQRAHAGSVTCSNDCGK